VSFLRLLACAALLAIAGHGHARGAPDAVAALTGQFMEARQAYDVAALEALTAEDYVEVTEAGELRRRPAMLAFHALGRREVYRVLQVEPVQTRMLGDVAVQTVLLSYKTIAAHKDLYSAARATLVARQMGEQWKLVSAHFTVARPLRGERE
jgi:uncharacterized protein (TIGR02246 family)